MDRERSWHREEIRALVTDFTIFSDRGRFADVAACFTEACVVKWANGGARGRANIPESITCATANPQIAFVRHHLTTMQIKVADDLMNATGRLYFHAMTNAGFDHAGVYVDTYLREDDGWLIDIRECRIDWQSRQSLYPPSITRRQQ